VKVPLALMDEILVHAREEFPNECCGMVASKDGVAVKVFPAVNAAASPLRYEIDPMEQLKIEEEIWDAGWDLGVIYHSHTRSDPVPSETDRNLAFHPDSIYMIIGIAGYDRDVALEEQKPADVRGWYIRKGVSELAELEIV